MLTISGLTKSHGDRTLFRDVTFQLSPGRRVALIGGNGVGKTTICEIIVGLQDPDSGEVSRPNDYVIGYLAQELLDEPTDTVVAEVMAGAGEVLALEAELTELNHAMAAAEANEMDDLVEAYGKAQSRYETLGGYQIEAEARRILGGLGFSAQDMERPLREMSGGWQMRAALARLLLQKPDVLVLDEPTNHLDVDSVAWLEQQLAGWTGALLFVSHDRDFIDAVAERCIEIAWSQAQEYVGGFAEFVVAREERLAVLEATAARQAREVARVERFIDRFRYKATKAKQVQSRIKTLEKLERIEVPQDEELKLKFAFPAPARSSRTVVEVVDADLGYEPDQPILRDVNLVVERGWKMALLGPNGAGKSTLLKTILGRLEPLKGTTTLGANVDVAYFAQHQVDALDLNRTVEQEFRAQVGPQPKNRNLRTVLGSFGFSGDSVERQVGALSGGERTRLALAATMCNPVNLLVLDEPTNHLDLPSCDILEDALRVYPGTVLLVSHDRYLIRNTAEQLLDVRDGTVTHYLDLDETVLNPGGVKLATSSKSAAPSAPPTSNQRGAAAQRSAANLKGGSTSSGAGKRTKSEKAAGGKGSGAANPQAQRELRKRVARMEKKATVAEEEVSELERRLASPDVYDNKDLMYELIEQHEKAKTRANRLLAEWEENALQLEDL